MRQLQIEHSYLQPAHQLIVRDIAGKEVYLIKGRWGRKNDTVELFSLSGERLVRIKQKNLSLFPTFAISLPNHQSGSLRKHPGFFGIQSPYFSVEPFHWLVTGNFEKRHYQIRSTKETLMSIQKVATAKGHRYSLFVYTEEYEPLCVAISVVIDHLTNERQSKTRTEEDYDLRFGFLNFKLTSPHKISRYRLSSPSLK